MPTNKPNSISSLRGRFDPHYKLSGKVEGLEKGISDQVSQIHKTISKSFVTQRKTLTRVLGLEKRVNHLEIQEAAEEQAKENLDEILSDIREDEAEAEAEVGGTKTKTKPKAKKKKKPKAKKSKISASAFKKGTSQESLEERVERIAQNKVDEAAAEQHKQTAEYQETTTGVDSETGEALSPEERKRRFKLKKGTISTSKFFDKEEPKALPEGEKGGELVKIGNSVTSIVETLKADQKQDKKQQGWFRKIVERFKRRKKENKLEFKVFDGIKKTATKLLAPMKGAWGSFLDFIGKIILGRVLFKILKWMGNKDNQGKLQSIIKFFKDWWPAILAGYLLFGNALSGFALGLLKNLVVWGAKLVATVIPALMKALAAMGPLGWGLLATGAVVGGGMYLANRNKNKEGEGGDTNVEATGGDTNVEAAGGDTNVEATGDQEVQKMNKGGTVPGSGNTDTVPAMLTPGEFVMSKGAVQKYGADTLAGMNAAAGGTNKPKLGRYNEGGKVQTLSEKLGHTRGVMTDPEEIKQQKDYMLKFVNEERALQGLEPLTKITMAPGVEMTKMMGPGPRTMENISTEDDIIGGTRTTARSKTVEGHGTKLSGEISQLTDEDKAKFYAENPYMKTLVAVKDQVELDNLGADISASAKMNGGGLVPGYAGGGKVGFFGGMGNIMGGKTWSGESRRQIGRSTANIQPKNIKPRKTATVITPSEKKKVTVAYEEEKQKMENKPNVEQSEKKIPHFNVMLGRSGPKIKVLGISV